MCHSFRFFFYDTATTEIYTYGHTLSLHDALPISKGTIGRMHALSTTAMAVLGVIMALWLVGAAWEIYSGFAMRRRSAFTAEKADRLTTLLESEPALTVVVRADGRNDATDRQGGGLGLEKVAKCITQIVEAEGGWKP